MDDSYVQTAACGLLNNIAYDEDLSARVGGLGGVRLILTAMKAHADNGRVLRNACAALGNLSSTDANFERLVKSHGIEHLFCAYNCDSDTFGLQQLARNALQNMGVNNADRPTTSLHIASVNAEGDTSLIERMLRGLHTPLHGDQTQTHFEQRDNFDVNAIDDDANTALHLALKENDVELTEYLVYCGADVHAVNNDGEDAESIVKDFESELLHDDAVSAQGLRSALSNGTKRVVRNRSSFRRAIRSSTDLCDDLAWLIVEFINPVDMHVAAASYSDDADSTRSTIIEHSGRQL